MVVLLIEDNPGDARLMQEMLHDLEAESSGYGPFHLHHVDRLAAGLEYLDAGTTDIALLDLSLPDSHGLASYTRLQEATPDLPVVVVTGHRDRSLALDAMRAGAQDYLTKGQLDGELLGRALHYAVERKRTEVRLQQAAADLEAARIRAEEASQAKSTFLANMSHEIRTPMNGVLGFADLLRSTPLTEDQAEYVEAIHTSGVRLLRLINDILDLSRIEAQRIELVEAPFEPAACLQDTLTLFAPLAAEKGVRLTLHVDSGVPATIPGDESRVQQVLTNLLSNAVKFTDEGTIHVAATLEEQHGGRPVLHVSVQDTGVGISTDRQARLFEAFYQVDTSLHRNHEGVGLGLAISRQLVELMGGRIWVESEAGRGSTFHFTVALPDAPGLDAASTPGVADATPAASVAEERLPLHILLAEDDPINQKLLLHMLKRHRYDVDVVSNGQEALEAVQRARYDIVLMDVRMPVMNGVAATRAILKQFPDERPRIVAITAQAMHGDAEECLAAGMDDYLSKPISMRALVDTIEKGRIRERAVPELQ